MVDVDADELLRRVLIMMDFAGHRKYCCAQEEELFQQIEFYLESKGITEYRLKSK